MKRRAAFPSLRPPRALLVALLALGAVPSAAASTPASPDATTSSSGSSFPFPMAETTLDNGLRLVVLKTDERGMFALYTVIGTGSRDEVEPGKSGFAHFFEHMMFRGTARFPADARTALLASLGVDESGYTTDDYTAYHLQGPKEAIGKILELEGDRFQNLVYTEDVFRTESQAVLGEYNKSAADPDNKAWEALSDLAFDRHTYKHTTIGFEKDVRAMPEGYAYSRAFFERFYVPDNAILIVAGDVDAEAVRALVMRHFGGWKGKRAKTAVSDEPPLRKERRATMPWSSPTLARLQVGWRVPSSVRDEAAGALSSLLSGYLFSASSPLTQTLVREERLAEDVSSWFEPHRDAALFPVVARVREGKDPDAVLARIQAALDALGRGEIDRQRFEAVKSNLKYGILMRLTTADAIAGTVARFTGPAMDPRAIHRALDAVARARPEDLVAFVRRHFGASQRAVVVVQSPSEVRK